jgi:hypothetical protein
MASICLNRISEIYRDEIARMQLLVSVLTKSNAYGCILQRGCESFESPCKPRWDRIEFLVDREWAIAADIDSYWIPESQRSENTLCAWFSILSDTIQQVPRARYEACRYKAPENKSLWSSIAYS